MGSTATTVLVQRAKAGDREAWNEICTRLYDRWVRRFHAELGSDLRRVFDTEDLVQSAIGDALRDVDHLRCDAAFEGWVNAIIWRKLSAKRRGARPRESLLLAADMESPVRRDALSALFATEDYLAVLDAMLACFPIYHEHMAMLYFKVFENDDTASLVKRFQRSERTVHRFTKTARELVLNKLPSV